MATRVAVFTEGGQVRQLEVEVIDLGEYVDQRLTGRSIRLVKTEVERGEPILLGAFWIVFAATLRTAS